MQRSAVPREPGLTQEERYLAAIDEFGPALQRLAHAYEANPDLRRDLIQEIHLAIWRSCRTFDGRCSLRTWVYRVAHNTAASHVTRAMLMTSSVDAWPSSSPTPSSDASIHSIDR